MVGPALGRWGRMAGDSREWELGRRPEYGDGGTDVQGMEGQTCRAGGGKSRQGWARAQGLG